MKQQVVVIHGGRTFATYQKYIDSLKNREVDISKFKCQKDWRDSLEETLGKDFEVFVPKMPNSNNAVYKEWKIWFERLTEFLHKDVILIGHSLGGIFLVKYLCENIYSKKIKAVVLVAAPFNEGRMQECLGDFMPPASFKNFSSQVKNICLLYSKDDPVVPFEHATRYKRALPYSEIIIFENKEHFQQESFLEIAKLIKNM